MTDRDRLIELLKKADSATWGQTYESYADYILADGWIRPPCKVGDTVYIPVLNTILHTKVFAFGIDEDGNKVINPKEYPEGVFGVVGCEIGKTAFLTKEEAEKALEGMNNA
jgi:hypothetical protein